MHVIPFMPEKPTPDIGSTAERAFRVAMAVADAWKIEPPCLASPEADPEELLALVARMGRALHELGACGLPLGMGEMCDKG